MKRRRPWLYFAICALGLPLYLWAFLEQAHQGTVSPADLPSGLAFPVRLGGSEADSPGELRFLAEGRAAGTAVVLVPAAGESFPLTLPRNLSLPTVLITLVSGLFFWAVSALVFAPRTLAASAVRDFFWCTFLYGLAIMIGGIRAPAPGAWPIAALGILQLVCLAVLPIVFVHLTLVFPRRQPLLDRAPALIPVLAALTAGLILWQSVAFLRYAPSPRPALYRALALPMTIADATLVAEVLAGLAILSGASRRLELTREQAQVKWLLWGFAVGVTPYVFLRTLPQLCGFEPPFGPSFDRIFEMAIPVAFIFAVVRYRFLDIDIIIRRSVIYALLALFMVAVYLGFGILIGQRVETLPPRSLILAIAIGAGAGLMFQPLRRAIGRGVDRTLFKLSHGYGQALAAFSGRLTHVHAQQELLRTVDEFLGGTLHVQQHAVLLREKGELLSFGKVKPEAIPQLAQEPWPLCESTLAAAGSTSTPELEDERFPAALSGAGIVLVEPLHAGTEIAGFVLLGRKQTERRFVDTDLELVRATAAEAGRTLERIRLVQTADEEAYARRRAEELDRLKSDFLSRVAHDLRTPLASIAWSTDNLIDGIPGAVSAPQQEYLRSIKASAGHLGRLVSNLLEISRLEQGRIRLELGPVALDAVVGEALLTLRPLADEKHVALRFVAGDPRPVHGSAEKLLEVVLNLADNAIRFSPPGAAVEIGTARAPDGLQELTVRDHGPGLGTADPQALFERFYQGPGSPHAPQQGFGLGLHIVKSYVELMRGTVTAGNHPEGGAVFTCCLRCAEGPEGDS